MMFLICLLICVACYSVGYICGTLKNKDQALHVLTAAWILWHEKKSLLDVKKSDVDKAFCQFSRDVRRNNPLERVL